MHVALIAPPPGFSVHLYRIYLNNAALRHGLTPLVAPPTLSSSELARYFSIPPTKRLSFGATRTALREVLSLYTTVSPRALSIETSARGKPCLSCGSVGFSLAHTDVLCVVAVARGRVGVDVERKGRKVGNVERMAGRWFSEREREWVGGDGERFLRTWTRKEAFVKATGSGVGRGDMKEFWVRDGRVEGNGVEEGWRVADFTVDGQKRMGEAGREGEYVGSVVVGSEKQSDRFLVDGNDFEQTWFTY